MKNKEKFKKIERLIDEEQISKLRIEMTSLRKELSIDPDYLYLMSNLLHFDQRIYQAIDALVLSINVNMDDIFLNKNNYTKSDNEITDKKFKLLSKLFSKIGHKELSDKALIKHEQASLISFLLEKMPGLKIKKN